MSRPVFYTPKYIDSNGILGNYMVINRAINDHIITQNTIRFCVFWAIKYGSARINRVEDSLNGICKTQLCVKFPVPPFRQLHHIKGRIVGWNKGDQHSAAFIF